MAHFLAPLLKKDAAALALFVEGRHEPLAVTVEAAFDSATRNRGLLGRDGLAADAALVIAPTNAVHTFGMRFPIDVIYCAKDGRIVKVRPNLVRGRISVAIGAFAVIEMAAGAIERNALETGQVLLLRKP